MLDTDMSKTKIEYQFAIHRKCICKYKAQENEYNIQQVCLN